jgi:hypothetical protein
MPRISSPANVASLKPGDESSSCAMAVSENTRTARLNDIARYMVSPGGCIVLVPAETIPKARQPALAIGAARTNLQS